MAVLADASEQEPEQDHLRITALVRGSANMLLRRTAAVVAVVVAAAADMSKCIRHSLLHNNYKNPHTFTPIQLKLQLGPGPLC